MTTSTSSTASDLLTLLKSDALVTFGPQLVTLIQALMAANNDPLKEAAAWIQFQGNIAPALLQFEATVAQQILAVVQAKVEAAIASAQATVSAATQAAAQATATSTVAKPA